MARAISRESGSCFDVPSDSLTRSTIYDSPYLAAGIVSPRELLRMTMQLTKNKLVTERNANGIGMWVTEVAWRDFYQHVSGVSAQRFLGCGTMN